MRRWRYELANYLAKSEQQGDCIVWTGFRDAAGYGRTGWHGRRGITAHRAVWFASGHSVPKGRELDHICRNRACIRLDHLRVVTHLENLHNRARPLGLACIYGHPKVNGACKTCRYAAVKRWRAAHPEQARESDRVQKRRRRAAKRGGGGGPTSPPGPPISD